MSLLNVNQAAEYLNLSKPTLDRFRGTGEGPKFCKMGSKPRAAIRYRKVDLDQWVEESIRKSTSG